MLNRIRIKTDPIKGIKYTRNRGFVALSFPLSKICCTYCLDIGHYIVN